MNGSTSRCDVIGKTIGHYRITDKTESRCQEKVSDFCHFGLLPAAPPSIVQGIGNSFRSAHASCTKTRAGTPRGSRDTAPWRSRSHRGHNRGIAAPAHRRSRAKTRTGARSAPPTAPQLVVQRIEKAVQGCPAGVPRPVQATRLCGQGDAPCLPQRGGTSEHDLILTKGQACYLIGERGGRVGYPLRSTDLNRSTRQCVNAKSGTLEEREDPRFRARLNTLDRQISRPARNNTSMRRVAP